MGTESNKYPIHLPPRYPSKGLGLRVYGLWLRVDASPARHCRRAFGVWCLVFGVWCLVFGVWCLVFGFCFLFLFFVFCFFGLWGLGFGVSGFAHHADHPHAPVQGRGPTFEFRVSGFGFRVSGFGFRVSGFGFRSFGFRVSGFGFRVSGFGRSNWHRRARAIRQLRTPRRHHPHPP
ncbi:hypothetical protein T484DRAFT_3213969 [Baffinella frigidus]|nr:hypothetical protein T484DRAFT_3213969 [Cryptophyta sp. CCMP2293]